MKFSNGEDLALYAIRYFLENGKIPDIPETDIDARLNKDAASFVTVYKDKKLRGCIGNAVANGPLYKSIIDNAIYAASRDYRFEPVKLSEFLDLSVEVSVLSPLEKYVLKDIQEFLKFLAKDKPGLMLTKNGRSALFLPQVWDELSQPDEFLNQLCLKAGLAADDWQSQMDFWIFKKVEV
jgi:AmmeMemoRadiSam system protein A